MFLGSDALALAPLTNRITYLEEGDWAVITRDGAEIYDDTGQAGRAPDPRRPSARPALIGKGNYRHFMLKEIYEQPAVIGDTLAHYLDFADAAITLPRPAVRPRAGRRGSPSSPAAPPTTPALVGKYWFETLARLPVDIDIASEFRYREMPLRRAGSACSSPSRARPPTRWRRCAMRKARADVAASSTCRE